MYENMAYSFHKSRILTLFGEFQVNFFEILKTYSSKLSTQVFRYWLVIELAPFMPTETVIFLAYVAHFKAFKKSFSDFLPKRMLSRHFLSVERCGCSYTPNHRNVKQK